VLIVTFYKTQAGICPVEEFIDSLSSKQAQKVAWVLRLFEEFETVPSQYFKKLVSTDDIWEVRVNVGGDTFRLLGFLDNSYIVLTNGFAKKTEKTPPQEIELAEQRRNEYFSIQEKE
jgi:phage-related protein